MSCPNCDGVAGHDCETSPLTYGRTSPEFWYTSTLPATAKVTVSLGDNVDDLDLPDGVVIADHIDVHTFFGLSYASYLVVNRSLLQSMPLEWQYRFTECMEELWHQFRDVDEPLYTVSARDRQGRFIKDPIPNYNRGRTFVEGVRPVFTSDHLMPNNRSVKP